MQHAQPAGPRPLLSQPSESNSLGCHSQTAMDVIITQVFIKDAQFQAATLEMS